MHCGKGSGHSRSLRSRRRPTALSNGRRSSILGPLTVLCLCCSSGRMDGASSVLLPPGQSLLLAPTQPQWEAMGTALLALLSVSPWNACSVGQGPAGAAVTSEGREPVRRDQCSTGLWGGSDCQGYKRLFKKLVHFQVR